jgi:hypothetical protein
MNCGDWIPSFCCSYFALASAKYEQRQQQNVMRSLSVSKALLAFRYATAFLGLIKGASEKQDGKPLAAPAHAFARIVDLVRRAAVEWHPDCLDTADRVVEQAA